MFRLLGVDKIRVSTRQDRGSKDCIDVTSIPSLPEQGSHSVDVGSVDSFRVQRSGGPGSMGLSS